jgi:protein SCO1/2
MGARRLLRRERELARNSKIGFVLGLVLGVTSAMGADPPLPNELDGVGVDEKLGETIDLSLEFMATDGYPKPLSNYFGKGRPVILNLVYYTCPMLCNLVLNGQTNVLREIPWTPGKEYDVVTISIDPTETWNLAIEKRATVLASFDRPAPGWHFFTDYNGNVKKLAEQVGWRYKYDPRGKQYAHSSAVMILTPEGKVSRYLYGIKYNPRDVRLALAEASEEKIGMTFERVLLMCFHYDPQAGSYVVFATNFMRLGGLLTVLAIGFFLYRMWKGDRRNAAVPANLS